MFGFLLELEHLLLASIGLVKTIRIATTFQGPTSRWSTIKDFLIFADHIVDIQNHDVVWHGGVVDKVSQARFQYRTSFQD